MRSTLVRCLSVVIAITFVSHAQAGAQEDHQLVTAIMSSDIALVRAAIQAGANVNADLGEGRTPLITAAMSTKPLAVKLLLEHGADPNRRADDPRLGNALTAAFSAMNGIQLMGRADEPDPAKRAEAMIVLRLIAAQRPDCDLLIRRAMTQQTALMMAAEAGMPDIVRTLLEAGASPNVLNGGKYSALDYAVGKAPLWSQAAPEDRVEVVRLLLAAGAQTQRKSADGLNAIERAQRGGNQAVVDLLVASR